MPVTLTYPGVYLEEIPSGVRTITGVSTSDTAFVDVFSRGPVDKAVRIASFGDFQRTFGGLYPWSAASYAIQQYFLNGGAVAWVVRVAAGNPQTAQATLQGGSPLQNVLTASAANPGAWGSSVQVAVTPAPAPDQFNLFVREVTTSNGRTSVVSSEVYRNVGMNPAKPGYVVGTVNGASALVTLQSLGVTQLPAAVAPTPSGDVPDNAWQPLKGGTDGTLRDGSGMVTDGPGFSAALLGKPDQKTGMYALDTIDPFIFNILCLPAAADLDAVNSDLTNFTTGNLDKVITTAAAYCESKRAFLIADIPSYVTTPPNMVKWLNNNNVPSDHAAVYFPRLQIADAQSASGTRNVAASGTLAGVYARTDATRGVWKAPAGTDANLRGASLAVSLTDPENGSLNPLGINALRNFPIFGTVSWGARTLAGSDQQASDWKYIPVRRTALYIEQSLYQGLKWVVFEPNDEPLWAQIRLNAGAFMQNLFRQGAFQGKSPREAYFVKCDSETTTQNDINLGIVNIVVGFAPLKPAEFVIIRIQQMAGQIQV